MLASFLGLAGGASRKRLLCTYLLVHTSGEMEIRARRCISLHTYIRHAGHGVRQNVGSTSISTGTNLTSEVRTAEVISDSCVGWERMILVWLAQIYSIDDARSIWKSIF